MSEPVEVLLLHGVEHVGPEAPRFHRGNAVAPETLDRLLHARRELDRPSPAALLDADRARPGVLLTFDDGWRSVLTDALPLIERHEIQAVVFVTTAFVDGSLVPYELRLARWLESATAVTLAGGEVRRLADRAARDDAWRRLREPLKACPPAERETELEALCRRNGWRQQAAADGEPALLDWDDVAELDRHPLVTIGAHSHRHPRLDALGPWAQFAEMRTSRRILERRLGHAVEWMAYPYGANGRTTRRLARMAGYRGAFTTEPRAVAPGDDPYALPRLDAAGLLG